MNQIEKIYKNTKGPVKFAAEYLQYLEVIFKKLDTSAIGSMIDIFLQARNQGKTIFFIGNGGSASTASHFANDIAIGTRSPEKPFKAVSLCDNISILTAIGNDYGYDQVFVKQLETQMVEDDVLVAISASGNSPNVINAVEYAKKNHVFTIGLSGFDGGKLKRAVDLAVHVPSSKGEYGPVEDVHMIFDHLSASFLKQLCVMENAGD